MFLPCWLKDSVFSLPQFATGHNTCVFIDRFPCSLLSDLSVSAMEVTGEQQQDVEHKPFKQRLDKAASPVTPEAATHELGKEEEKVFDPNALDADRCESCYGAESEDIRWCNTCDDVREAYRRRGWAFENLDSVKLCKREGFSQKMQEWKNEGCQVYGSLEASWIKRTVVLTACKHPGHPFFTLPSCLEKDPTAVLYVPSL
ncbi:endoplasmic reticulum-Golgi intermediate compartment protein 3-like isoform X3 [Falco cherrug]|uniref:endoplasmic reticulum-Golgi intermediate compartment protein 3-like isoform X3 n=2 Tax=Falco TaxID=8952 RepID=UPI00247921AD|nr:endoplasmic reticulum-Golgi intermediate compartment protein 3-like isoform X3 [Falco cherrug]